MDEYRRIQGRRAVKSTVNRDWDNIEHLSVFDIRSGECLFVAKSVSEFTSSDFVLENFCILVINYKGGRYKTQFLNFQANQ